MCWNGFGLWGRKFLDSLNFTGMSSLERWGSFDPEPPVLRSDLGYRVAWSSSRPVPIQGWGWR